jgi:hypothetical protein
MGGLCSGIGQPRPPIQARTRDNLYGEGKPSTTSCSSQHGTSSELQRLRPSPSSKRPSRTLSRTCATSLNTGDENMPIFNGNSKEVPPRASGKRFAARNPTGTPYWSSEWNSKEGPLLFPKGPPAAKLHDALDRVESFVVQRRPELMEYIPERSDQPWLGDDWGKIDGAPTRPRSGARPTDIAQPTPEVRTRLPRSGRWATPGPRTTGPQRTTPVTSGPASPEVTDLTRVAASRDPLGLSDTEEDGGSNLSRPRWRHCI